MILEDELLSFVMVGRKKYPVRISSVKLACGLQLPTDGPRKPLDVTIKTPRLPDFEMVYRLKSHQRAKIELSEMLKSDQVAKVIIDKIREHTNKDNNN